MTRFGLVSIALLGAGVAPAQMLPLGTPIMPQNRSAAPSATARATGRVTPAEPMGANNLPANIQPQTATVVRAPSSIAEQKQVVPGTVTDPNLAVDSAAPAAPKVAARQPGDMRSLAPKAPERTAMPQADSAAPH